MSLEKCCVCATPSPGTLHPLLPNSTPCPHPLCQSCAEESMIVGVSSLNSRKVLECKVSGCGARFTSSQFRVVIDHAPYLISKFNAFVELEAKHQLMRNKQPDQVLLYIVCSFCSYSQCNWYALVPKSTVAVYCQNCKVNYCLKCHLPAHGGSCARPAANSQILSDFLRRHAYHESDDGVKTYCIFCDYPLQRQSPGQCPKMSCLSAFCQGEWFQCQRCKKMLAQGEGGCGTDKPLVRQHIY